MNYVPNKTDTENKGKRNCFCKFYENEFTVT